MGASGRKLQYYIIIIMIIIRNIKHVNRQKFACGRPEKFEANEIKKKKKIIVIDRYTSSQPPGEWRAGGRRAEVHLRGRFSDVTVAARPAMIRARRTDSTVLGFTCGRLVRPSCGRWSFFRSVKLATLLTSTGFHQNFTDVFRSKYD